MPDIEGVEPLYLLPNRLAIADFSESEMQQVLGESVDQELSKDNFNWIGAYLVEQAGLREIEVAEWFRSSARGLEGQQPLEVWGRLEGFIEVFDYAKRYKQSVEEYVDVSEDTLVRSHDIANSALDIILKGFESAGLALEPAGDSEEVSHTIWNPGKADDLTVRWKRIGDMEDYRVSTREGARGAMYYIVRYLPPGSRPQVWQSGVVPMYEGKMIPSSTDSDLDGRAPSAGEVASFVVPLANEVKNRSLELVR